MITSVLGAAALFCAPVSWARAQDSVKVLQASDRTTVTPTSTLAAITSTANPTAEAAMGTPTPTPALNPLATAPIVSPTGTPMSNRVATATPGSPVSPTAASPNVTAAPTVTSISTAIPQTPLPTPTIIPADPAPLDVTIRAGSDPTRTVNLGEQIMFTVELKTRESLADNLFITATIPEGTEYVTDSAVPMQATVTTSSTLTGTSAASPPVPIADAAKRTLSWQVQPMGAGQRFVAQYVVKVNRVTDSIVASASAVNIQTGQASTSNAVVLPTQPTAITLLRFETHPHPLGIKIVWQTGQEVETFGFVLLRSNSEDRMAATLITPKLIGAQGSGVGASYEYVDSGVSANQRYWYWLQEVEASGAVHDYGPLSAVTVSQSPQIVIAGPVGAGGIPLPVQVSGVDPNIAQTAQAVLQRNSTTPGQPVNQVNQVSAQPVASPVAQPTAPQPIALPPAPTAVVVPDAQPTAAVVVNEVIATIEPATVVVGAAVPNSASQPISPSVALAATATPSTSNASPEATLGSTSADATVVPSGGEALPAAPANAQKVVPQMNVAAPQASEGNRTEPRWGLLNWLFAGLLACLGWLIVSSFLAVAVGRYLKGRQ